MVDFGSEQGLSDLETAGIVDYFEDFKRAKTPLGTKRCYLWMDTNLNARRGQVKDGQPADVKKSGDQLAWGGSSFLAYGDPDEGKGRDEQPDQVEVVNGVVHRKAAFVWG